MTGDKPALKLSPVGLGWVTTFKQKLLYRSYYFLYFKQILFNHCHSFSLVLKWEKRAFYKCYTILYARLQLMWVESVLCQWLAYNLLWPCSLTETSDRVNWDSLITKNLIFEVSSQSLKRREIEKMDITINPYVWPDEMHT